MGKRSYGEYCGLAHALDLVGDRWTLLIVRDLAVEPKRFGDLLSPFAGLSTNLLSERLKHLEGEGLVTKRLAPRPLGGVRYALTPDGERLARAMAPLGAWGAARIGPIGGRLFRPEWLMFSLRTFFDADAARDVHDCYEFRIDGEGIWAVVEDGEIEITTDKPCEPDFVLVTDVPTLALLGDGTLTIDDAVSSGAAVVEGDPAAGGRALAILGSAAR